MVGRYGPHNPAETYVPHKYPERLFDTGEVLINYATIGKSSSPALLLIPGQTESWWGFEAAIDFLRDDFEIFAVDLRGQGRSGRTPGRYTLDNMGNDLVRVIQSVIGRPAIVSGLSSGGVLSAWLSAYAPKGLVRGAHYEDPPLFSSEFSPSCGQSIKQAIGPMFAAFAKYLGDQWDVGDWKGLVANAPNEVHPWMRALPLATGDEPPQNLKEYDPVKVPVLFTHHFRHVDEATGLLMGAISDVQATRVRTLIEEAGQPFDYRSFPAMGHSMHGQDPQLFAGTLRDWALALPAV